MAGMMYLGNQKVTPVIVQGGNGYEEFPTYQLVNGTAIKRGGVLEGDEFKNIVTIETNTFYYSYYQCTELTGFLDLSSLITVKTNGMYDTFYECAITGVDLSSLETVESHGMYEAFYNCEHLVNTDLSSLKTVGINGLYYSYFYSGLSGSLDISSLVSVGSNGLNNAFAYTKITSLNVSSLESVGRSGLYGCCHDCTELSGDVIFSSLKTIGSGGLNNAFQRCPKITGLYFNALTSQSFGSYTNQFHNMLYDVNGCTVHFPSNLESVIGEWSDVLDGFGGENTTVLFDLEATS